MKLTPLPLPSPASWRRGPGRPFLAGRLQSGWMTRVVEGLFSQWIDEVSCGLASLIHIFDPPLVVLGGGIMSPPQTIRRIENRLPHFLRESYQGVPILGAALGNQAGMLRLPIWRWSSPNSR